MKKGVFLRRKQEQRSKALVQIESLFDQAAHVFRKDPEKAQLLVSKAYKLVLRTKIKLPLVIKRRFCKHCKSLWVPGKTVRVRLTKGRVVMTCIVCRRIKRLPAHGFRR